MSEPAHGIKVRVFIRHQKTCDHVGEEGHANCCCSKWLRYTRHGSNFVNKRTLDLSKLRRRRHENSNVVSTRAKIHFCLDQNQPKKATIAAHTPESEWRPEREQVIGAALERLFLPP